MEIKIFDNTRNMLIKEEKHRQILLNQKYSFYNIRMENLAVILVFRGKIEDKPRLHGVNYTNSKIYEEPSHYEMENIPRYELDWRDIFLNNRMLDYNILTVQITRPKTSIFYTNFKDILNELKEDIIAGIVNEMERVNKKHINDETKQYIKHYYDPIFYRHRTDYFINDDILKLTNKLMNGTMSPLNPV